MAAIKQASWIHGTSVHFENQSWAARALRQAFFTTVTPSNESSSGWVHFAIPTPVIVNGTRSKAQSGIIRFSTGSQASIRSFHIYDGETRILANDSLNLTGNIQIHREVINGTPDVQWGIGISLQLFFNGTGPDAWVQLVSAGMDFI